MMLEIIMNMPVRASNAPVHRIVAKHPANTLLEFIDILHKADFVIVEEFYPVGHSEKYVGHGPIVLNNRYIGKVKEWTR
jgi:hypothetical protein